MRSSKCVVHQAEVQVAPWTWAGLQSEGSFIYNMDGR